MTSGPYQLLPELPAEDTATLVASIREFGVQVPIIIDENGVTIDGHHRKVIADTLGVEYPTEVRSGLSEAEKRTLALDLNVNRRQLDPDAKKKLVTTSLLADPGLSDRQHAVRCGVDHKRIGRVRGILERAKQIPVITERATSDGRRFPSNGASPQCPPADQHFEGQDRTTDQAPSGDEATPPASTSTGAPKEPASFGAEPSPSDPSSSERDEVQGEPPPPAPDLLSLALDARVRWNKALRAMDLASFAADLDLEGRESWRHTIDAAADWVDASTAALDAIEAPQPLRSVQ